MDGPEHTRSNEATVDLRTPVDERLMALLVATIEEYAIFALDPGGRVTSWNKGAQRIKGYQADEIIGQHFSVFYPSEDIRAGKPERELHCAVTRGHASDEGWRVRKDGTRFWANVTITALFDQEGDLEGFAKITRDDTDRKRLDEQVRQLELFTDRERIAHSMHTTIVHRIFEASLAMEGALRLVQHPVAVDRITTAVAALDETLRQLRTIILGLETADSEPTRTS